jgi:hypothetical protein
MQYRFATNISEVAPSSEEQIMSFQDASTAYNYEVVSRPDPTFNSGDYGNADLGEFLSRPIRIGTYQWALNANFNQVFNPWSLYFSDPAVIARINNYALLRCKMRIKVVINATKFHYGRALLSYDPWPQQDQVSPIYIGSQDEIVLYSQRPHAYINPTNSEGCEMLLPFFHLENWLDVTDANSFAEMGECRLSSFNTLRHASAGTSDVTVSIFAWAEDVKLRVPTATPALQPLEAFAQAAKSKRNRGKKSRYNTSHQSINNVDEYSGDGIISGPATAVAEVAGALEAVPVLAPFAMATRLAATAVSGVAKIFGFSRPVILDKVGYFKPKFASSLAATDLDETVSKLTIDSKQEITVDPRTVGLEAQDELLLDYLTSKETYLTQFTWKPTHAVDRLLFTSQVAPMLEYAKLIDETEALYYPTALSFATWPFRNWAGSIIFRFQVICSGFHQGRLRVSYNPTGKAQDTAGAFNTVYNRIIDINSEDDFELEVAWADNAPYKLTNWSKFGTHYDVSTTGQSIESEPLYDNGVITVRVLTELTAPDKDADITVNVFVRAGEDFELINPTGGNLEFVSYTAPVAPALEAKAQSADDSVNVIDASDPTPTGIGATPLFGQPDCDIMQMKKQVFFGETIKSFRTLLRRYNHYRSWPILDPEPPALGSLVRATLSLPAKPYTRGFNVNGLDEASTSDKYNYVQMTLLQYLMPAYAAWRGSMRSKFRETTSFGRHIEASRGYSDTFHQPLAGTTTFTQLNNNYSTSTIASTGVDSPSLMSGAVIHPTFNQPILEVEFPFQTGKRFAFARNVISTTSARDETSFVSNPISLTYEMTDILQGAILDEYQSVGEDFSMFFFVNAPPRWEYANPESL